MVLFNGYFENFNYNFMKHLLFTFLVIMSAFAPSNAQEVSKKQWIFLHERTADWCPFCGTWGWDFKGKLISEFATKPVVFAALHHSGGLANPTSEALSDNFEGAGQPIFYADGINLNVNSANQTQRLTDAKDIVEYNSASGAFAGIGINATYNPSEKRVNIEAIVEILEKIEGGEYSLGLYILEDKTWTQASRSSAELHKNVLTGSVFTETFGKPVFKGVGEKGSTFKFTGSIIEDYAAKIGKSKILGILWNKGADRYMFFNAVEVPIKLQSNTVNSDFDKSMSAYLNEGGNINVSVQASTEVDNVTLQLTDVKGAIVGTQSIGALPVGVSNFKFEAPETKGTYFVTFLAGQTITSRAVVIP
jgi:hypothetical protein